MVVELEAELILNNCYFYNYENLTALAILSFDSKIII